MLYDHPEYYDIAFSFRNYATEAAFLKECVKRYSKIPVQRVLELGCGTAPHAGELVKHNFQYIGLDINRNMLDYATDRWRGLQSQVRFVKGNMNNFSLEQPVDFAFIMLGSLYANGFAELTSHFNALAGALRPGGLYFLDWCIQFSDPFHRIMNNTVVNEQEGVTIESTFRTSLVDAARQMYEEIWTVNVDDHGERKTLQMIERNRAIFPQEFLLFVQERTDFEFVGWWYDWDFDKPIVDDLVEVVRPVTLLRRR